MYACLKTAWQHRNLCVWPDGDLVTHPRDHGNRGPWVLLWLTLWLRSTFPVWNTKHCPKNVRSAATVSHLPGKLACGLRGPIPTPPPHELKPECTIHMQAGNDIRDGGSTLPELCHISLLSVALVLRTDSDYCYARAVPSLIFRLRYSHCS